MSEKKREILAAYKQAMDKGDYAGAVQLAQELLRIGRGWSLAQGPSRWDALAQLALRAARLRQAREGLRVAEELSKILEKEDDDE